MEVFRLAREQFGGELSGKGSSLQGARWNSVGVELVYAASNRSLAMAEVAVHLTLATLPSDFLMMTIFVPDDIDMIRIKEKDLPAGWNEFPYRISSQIVGDTFARSNQACLLQVPSAVVQGEHNILINPKHKDFRRIKIVEKVTFPFDKRIFE